MQLFFSYGHDANVPLVLRLAAALRAEGYRVWRDGDAIRPGDDWRRAILDGEASAQRVIAFLSAHAMRPGGVCLDELAFALHHLPGRLVTVLLEAEAQVKPPVSLTHIQWLDLSAWPAEQAKGEASFEAWFAAQLGELRRILTDPERERFAGELDELHRLLAFPRELVAWARAARMGQLMEGFVGREWLRDRVEAWRTGDAASRLLWIAGDAGFGKSAFAAWLTHQGHARVVALNLCEFNDGLTREPALVIRALAYQLATREPSYRALLLGLLRADAKALDGTAGALFRRLIIGPLRAGIEGGRAADPLLIVLDGLDETLEGDRCELAEILAECAERLPGWVNLLVTSRKLPEIVRQLGGFTPLLLEPAAEDNRADLLLYARGWLGGRGFAGEALARKAAEVAAAADGNMLYLRALRDGVERGLLNLDDPRGPPPGLSAIYDRWLRRVFREPGEAPAGHYPMREDYARDFLPLISAVLATERPVPEAVLRGALGLGRREMARRLEALVGLFELRADGWATFHKSLRDWLLDVETAGPRWLVEREAGRSALAGWLWGRLGEIARQEEVGALDSAEDAFLLAEFPRLIGEDAAELRGRIEEMGGWQPMFSAAGSIARRLAAQRSAEAAVLWWDTAGRLADANAALAAHHAAARAAIEAGDLWRRIIGRLDKAHIRFDFAMVRLKAITTANPAHPDWQRDLSLSHIRLGDVRVASGDLPDALSAYRAGLEISERLAATDPANPGWQRDLLVSYSKIGDVRQASGDLPGALAAYRHALEISEHLAAADPANAERQRDLSVSHDRIGDVRAASGDLPGALAAYRMGLEIIERLAAADTANDEWQRDLSISHERIGDVRVATDDLPGALVSYRAALAIRERLVAADPTNTEWQRDLSIGHNKIGDVRVGSGDLPGALGAYRAALEIRERLAAADAANAQWQRDLFASHWKLHVPATDARQQVTHLRAARAQARQMVVRFPDMPEFPDLLAHVEARARELGLPEDDPPA